MKTKTIVIEGQPFVIAKLVIDDVEAYEEALKALAAGKVGSFREVYAPSRVACRAALARAGVTDPKLVGTLDEDGLRELVEAVLSFSHLAAVEPGGAPTP